MAGEGGGVEPEGGGKNFATYCRGGGGQLFFSILFFWGGRFFLARYFCKLFFRKSDITCIITVVGAQKQHKGMFFLNMRGGCKFFQQCHGGGGDFFPVYSRGGGRFFFYLSILPNRPPPSRPKLSQIVT